MHKRKETHAQQQRQRETQRESETAQATHIYTHMHRLSQPEVLRHGDVASLCGALGSESIPALLGLQ